MTGISWDAGWDGKVLSMPSAIVTRVGKRVAIMFGRTSAFGRIYALIRAIWKITQ
jgi:hypothetical protein